MFLISLLRNYFQVMKPFIIFFIICQYFKLFITTPLVQFNLIRKWNIFLRIPNNFLIFIKSNSFQKGVWNSDVLLNFWSKEWQKKESVQDILSILIHWFLKIFLTFQSLFEKAQVSYPNQDGFYTLQNKYEDRVLIFQLNIMMSTMIGTVFLIHSTKKKIIHFRPVRKNLANYFLDGYLLLLEFHF